MDGWTIVLVVGMLLIALLMGLVALISVTARRLASRAEAVLEALEEVRSKTEAMAGLAGGEQPPPPNGGGPAGSGGLAGSPDRA